VQKRIKIQKFLMFALAVVVAILIVSIVFGRTKTETILVVAKEGLNKDAQISTQLGFFQEVQILSKDAQKFGDSVVHDMNDLKSKYSSYVLTSSLKKGSPVPRDMLIVDVKTQQSAFTVDTPVYQTLYQLPSAILPGGLKPIKGDRIDVAMTMTLENNKGTLAGIFKRNVLVNDVDAVGNIMIIVSQKEYFEYEFAKKYAQFTVMLPGQKQADLCTDQQIELRHTIGSIQCYAEEDKAVKVFDQDILKQMTDSFNVRPEDIKSVQELQEQYNKEHPTVQTTVTPSENTNAQPEPSAPAVVR
jgi:hypothetical protein